MAEIQDLTSLQADSLPTGSISFGRFELESLSWERRSVFSHNRYLEEVEKYSKPGSVTQKKAYFEAHFKKKALERQASTLNHNGDDRQTAENGIQDHENYIEYVDQDNGGQHKSGRDGNTSDVPNEQEHDVMESTGGKLHFSWYDDTPPAISDEDYDAIESNGGQIQFVQYDEALEVPDNHQHDVIDCDQETDNLSSGNPPYCMPCSNMKALNYNTELVEHNEVIQNVSRYDTQQSFIDEPIVVVIKKNEDIPMNVNELPEECDISSISSLVEKDNATCKKKTQKVHVKSTVEQKTLKAKPQNQISLVRTTRKPTEKKPLSSAKASAKILRKTERENTLRTKIEKQSSLKVSPSAYFGSKQLKPKNFESLKAQTRQGTKSGKGPDVKDTVRSRSFFGNNERHAHQSTNRNNIYSTKVEIKQSNVTFSFRSEERAEKRREFYMRLEEKHHAKEVEMHENQARTQMKTEAEMKQLRRSLNFKAAPMPSFYHGSMPRDSNGRKMLVTQANSRKLQSAGSGCQATSQANSRAVDKPTKNGRSANEPVRSTSAELPVSEDDATSSIVSKKLDKPVAPRGINRVSQSARVGAGKREERVKPTAGLPTAGLLRGVSQATRGSRERCGGKARSEPSFKGEDRSRERCGGKARSEPSLKGEDRSRERRGGKAVKGIVGSIAAVHIPS